MFKLDNDFLINLGLGSLPVEEKNKLLQMIYERLEMNVGMRLAEKMTDQQLDEFESFIDKNDEQGALHWLETNFPNYKDVVAEELEKLKQEVGQAAPQIIAAAQNAQQQAPQAAQPVPSPPQSQPQPAPQPQFNQYQQQPAPQMAPQPPQPVPFQQQPMPPAFDRPQTPPPQPGFVPQQPGFANPAPSQPQQFTPPPPGFTPQ